MAIFNRKKDKTRIYNLFSSALTSFYRSYPATKDPTFLAIKHGIASTISTLELGLYQKASNRKYQVYNHPLAKIIARPNAIDGQTAFMYRAVDNYLSYGNVYIFLGNGYSYEILDPAYMMVSRNNVAPFNKIYSYSGNQLTDKNILHIYNPQYYDGLIGHSPLELNSELFERHSALLLYCSMYFNNSAGQRFLFSIDKELEDALSDEQTKMDFEAFLLRAAEPGKPLIVHSGVKAEKIEQTTNAEAELSSLIDRTEKSIAKLFGYPTFMLDGTYGNNLKDQQIHYLQSCIMPITEVLQEGFSRLINTNNPYVKNNDADFMEYLFNYDNLLMPDIETRHKILRDDRRAGLISINEARNALNRADYDGDTANIGDVLVIAANEIPAENKHLDLYFANAQKLKDETSE